MPTLFVFARASAARIAAATAARVSRARSLRMPLEHRCLGVSSESCLEGLDYLALGHVGPGAVEQRVHQVLVAACGLLERGERRLRCLAVAPSADCLHTVDLLLLELRIDTQDLDRLVVEDLVAVHPDHDALAVVDLLLVLE